LSIKTKKTNKTKQALADVINVDQKKKLSFFLSLKKTWRSNWGKGYVTKAKFVSSGCCWV